MFSFSFIFNKNEPRYFFTNWLFESVTSQLFYSNIIKGRRPCPTCHAKGQNEVFDSTHPPTSENVRCDQIFFFLSTILHRYHWRQSNCKKPTMITWFDQNGNITIKITKSFTPVSHMTLQAALLIDTTKPWQNFSARYGL